MAEDQPSSEVEGIMMESGSAPSPKGNTFVSVDSEEQATKPESDTVDKTTIDNGSGHPGLRNVVPESGYKGNDCAVNYEENGEQDIEEKGATKENDIGHSKEDITSEDAKPVQNEKTVEDDTIEDSGPMQNESTLEESKEDDTTEDERPVQKESAMEESKENDITEDAQPLQMESSTEESKEDDTIEDARPVQNENTIEESKGNDTIEDSRSVQKESTSQELKEDDTAKDARPVQKKSAVEESKEDNITEDARPVQKESIIDESKEDDIFKDARPVQKEIITEESKDDNRIEGLDTMAKQNDITKIKDKNEIEDTTVTIEDTKMVEEKGDKAAKGVTTTTAKSNAEEESKEGIKTDPSTAKSEDGKKTDAECDEIMAVEDGKMISVEGDKAIMVEDAEMVDAEDEKNEGVDKEEEGVEQEPKQVEPKDHMEGEENGNTEQKDNRDTEAVGYKRKRSQVQITKRKVGVSLTKANELLNSPISSSIERPVRERKAVERLVEVIENEASREFQVEKGRGTPLKDIPSVAHKLARKKPADIKLIHHTLFGRRGKAVNFKHHILQFSGFVWHESDEKQRAKMKEKLDKYVKDTLLDLCDLFDLPASKANSRKEELVEKLLDFLVAPHLNNGQSTKSRKRKRVAKGSSSKRMEGAHSKSSRKKENTDDASLSEGDKSSSEMDDGDEVNESSPRKGKAVELSESEDDDETHDMSKENEHEKEDLEKGNKEKKRVSKQKDSIGMEIMGTNSKAELVAATAVGSRPSSFLHTKAKDGADDVGTKVFSRKKKMAESPKKKSTIRSAKKEKDNGKRIGKDDKEKSKAQLPRKEELRKKICEILKEVDFNTATFTDILKLIATHYRVDLSRRRKASIKLIIQEELTKLDEAEDEDDGE